MRTNVEIDDELMTEAMRLGELKTKREAVDEALRMYVRIKRQADIRKLVGKVRWEGDLKKMRRSRFS